MERPILFSTPMVQAILEGRKTQTRRVLKPKTLDKFKNLLWNPNENLCFCPYGKPGDTLWVRETWQLLPSGFDEIPSEMNYIYKATDELSNECTRWRPSIHMPWEAARLFLKVTNVRAERLQDITEEDAKAEGIKGIPRSRELYPIDDFVYPFKQLWDSINAKHGYGWEANPWVWVIEFERI